MAHLEHLGLANNEIHSIPADSFNLPLTLRTLDLAGNPITSIDQKAFGPSLRTLFLNTTSLLCDCNLAWFGPWLQRTGLEDTIDEAKCAFPAALSGRNLLDLIDDPTVEFNCGKCFFRPFLEFCANFGIFFKEIFTHVKRFECILELLEGILYWAKMCVL